MTVEGEERRLLALERRIALAELLRFDPVLTVDELARRFSISPQTVRRDLQYLEMHGIIRRTHGGAVARHKDVLSSERAFLSREMERAAQKRAMAQAALSLVEPGSTILMDASTTVLYLARALPSDVGLSAVVNALPVAGELSERHNVTVTMLGGTMRRTSLSVSGPVAEANLRRIFADTAFISARGLSASHGLTEANPSESALKEIMVANAARVIALVDSSKLGRTAFSLFAPLKVIDVLITDDEAEPAALHQLRSEGLEVRVAPVST